MAPLGPERHLIIIGAGGFGREIYSWASQLREAELPWRIKGFLDANPTALEGRGIRAPILGDPSTYVPAVDEWFVCAIGNPATKLRLCRALRARGAHFPNLIHPLAYVAGAPTLGEGCILSAFSSLSPDVKMGDFVVLNAYSCAGHDAVLGDGCTISSHCDITGNAVLGEGVFLGSHASILPGKKVGDYAKVGAGSVVVRHVRAGATVMGVPAKTIAGFHA